jgi:hypothetical protein
MGDGPVSDLSGPLRAAPFGRRLLQIAVAGLRGVGQLKLHHSGAINGRLGSVHAQNRRFAGLS